MSEKQTTIMVVDDAPANLKLLEEMLRKHAYRVLTFPGGELALKAAAKSPPDLILLDINMPQMNGFEVCKRLKADESLKEIPVIFISALTETMDKLKAFAAGGVDYVTKPFQFEEVQARVETHMELRRQKRELKAAYDRLRELESLRDTLVHMIVHDMRTPLMVVSNYLQMAGMQKLPEQAADYITRAADATGALVEMVSSLLDVSKMEAGQMTMQLTAVDLRDLLKEALGKVESLKGQRALTLVVPDQAVMLTCDAGLILRVIQNLLGNALKFTDRERGTIEVRVEPGKDTLRVTVTDNGPGIPEDYHAKIFEKFGQVASWEQGRKYSTGLGLTFCKMAVETHGGRIGVDSEVGEGSTFWFELPRSDEDRREPK